ncbi:hypothetical protein ACFQ2M_18605 [Kitasatospora saccharophila]|uniref:hypothetical protein n=1 Tax=Kitasatospora saccharophila TaxID=407973 RepID=UPI003641442F
MPWIRGPSASHGCSPSGQPSTSVPRAAARTHLSSAAPSAVSTYQPSTIPSAFCAALGLRRFSTRTNRPERTVSRTFVPSSFSVAVPSPANTQAHSARGRSTTRKPASRSNSVGIFSMAAIPLRT